MADLGFRENVMGPQPIAPMTVEPAPMRAAGDAVCRALVARDHTAVEAACTPLARDEMMRIADAVASHRYSEFHYFGRARIAKHWILKVRCSGEKIAPLEFQFRLGEGDGRWTIREATMLTGKKSAWSK